MLKWKEKVVKEILYALRRVELLRVPAQGRLSVVGVSSRMEGAAACPQPTSSGPQQPVRVHLAPAQRALRRGADSSSG